MAAWWPRCGPTCTYFLCCRYGRHSGTLAQLYNAYQVEITSTEADATRAVQALRLDADLYAQRAQRAAKKAENAESIAVAAGVCGLACLICAPVAAAGAAVAGAAALGAGAGEWGGKVIA